MDLFESVANARAPLPEQVRVFGEHFDDNRFGRAGQIADHILQELCELDIQRRHLLVDLLTNVGDDLVYASLPFGLQLDGEIAAIGFRDGGESKLEPGPARGGLHFGRIPQDAFHLIDQTIGIGQRRAGGRKIVQNEAAFVHLRQQVRAECVIAKVRCRDERDAEDRRCPGTFQRHSQHAAINADNAAEKPALLRPMTIRSALARLAKEVMAESGSPCKRESERSEQSHSHRDGKRPKKHPVHAGDRNQRQQHDDGRQRRPDPARD